MNRYLRRGSIKSFFCKNQDLFCQTVLVRVVSIDVTLFTVIPKHRRIISMKKETLRGVYPEVSKDSG